MSVLYEAIEDIATSSPDRIALSNEHDHISFAELLTRASTLASRLRRWAGAGECVVTHLANTPEHVVLLLAMLKAGAIHVPSDLSSDSGDIEALASLCNAPLIVVDDNLETLIEGSVSIQDLTAANGSDAVAVGSISEAAVARYLQTSGSTGAAKLVSWTQDKLLANQRRWIQFCGVRSDDVVLNIHPLSSSHALDMHVLPALMTGARLVIAPTTAGPRDWLEIMQREGVSVMSALPRQYDEVALSASGDLLTSLRLALCGGAYLPPSTIDLVEAKLSVHLKRIYGSTEFGIILANLDPGSQRERGMYPVAGVEVRLFGGTSRLGELLARAEGIFSGYVGNPSATKERFVDDWYRSDDIVEDIGGEYWIRGRVGDVIVTPAGPLFCSEVEDQLRDACPVQDVVVIHDTTWLPRPLVAVVPNDGVSAQEAKSAVTTALARLEFEAMVETLEVFPRTPVGKPDRQRLINLSLSRL